MHVDREVVGFGEGDDLLQVSEWNCADAVRGHADADVWRSACELGEKGFGVAEEIGGRFEEASLTGIARKLEPRTQIRRAQEHYADADGLGGGDDLLAEEIWIVVETPRRIGVEVVELAD